MFGIGTHYSADDTRLSLREPGGDQASHPAALDKKKQAGGCPAPKGEGEIL